MQVTKSTSTITTRYTTRARHVRMSTRSSSWASWSSSESSRRIRIAASGPPGRPLSSPAAAGAPPWPPPPQISSFIHSSRSSSPSTKAVPDLQMVHLSRWFVCIRSPSSRDRKAVTLWLFRHSRQHRTWVRAKQVVQQETNGWSLSLSSSWRQMKQCLSLVGVRLYALGVPTGTEKSRISMPSSPDGPEGLASPSTSRPGAATGAAARADNRTVRELAARLPAVLPNAGEATGSAKA
mmetsp:Transcript_1762/g.4131  ORF Transcript_1762/g.4131 Transcript_1762/m.4131 type:complete len:237 (-) Transcript_1762:152-862(-)